MVNKKLGEGCFSLLDKKKRGTVLFVKTELNPQKIFADKQGRFIAVEITYQNEKVLIVNVYAPNSAKSDFV